MLDRARLERVTLSAPNHIFLLSLYPKPKILLATNLLLSPNPNSHCNAFT
jgi:WD40 repeat protein